MIDRAPGLTVVGEAATGHDAIRVAREARADVVLMDIRMPGLDGLAAPGTDTEALAFTLIGWLEKAVTADAAALMATSSFLDRPQAGPLPPERARQHGAPGPISKAAGCAADYLTRPYGHVPGVGPAPGRAHAAGDAPARLPVRWEEADQPFRLLRQVADILSAERTRDLLGLPCEPSEGSRHRMGGGSRTSRICVSVVQPAHQVGRCARPTALTYCTSKEVARAAPALGMPGAGCPGSGPPPRPAIRS